MLKSTIGIIVVICLSSTANGYHTSPFEHQAKQYVCPCTYKYNPVCGSDGVTYINECILNCTSALNVNRGFEAICKTHQSECSGDCNCQPVNLPVCTLDGLTYPNECELACENIKRIANKQSIIYLAYRTACVGPPGVCTDIAAPVCGTDNVLYRNRCVLDNASCNKERAGLDAIQVKNNGACLDGCLCPVTKQVLVVLGSDGNLYDNPCQLQCHDDQTN